MGRPGEGFDLKQILALSASFLLGLALIAGLANVFDQGEPVQLARAVGEPTDVATGASISAEVQGAVCETPADVVTGSSDALELLALWNAAVMSEGDSCSPAFADRLGEQWMMTDPTVSVLSAGSLYEVSTTDGSVSGLSLFLVADDSDAGIAVDLQDVISHVWGEGAVDWTNECSESTSAWAGVVATDGSDLSVSRCDA